jgi:hypothetical protein
MTSIQERPFERRFTALQLLAATLILGTVLIAAWLWTSDRPVRLVFWVLNAYVLFTAIWLPKRVVGALAVELNAGLDGEANRTGAFSRILEAALLPIYCAALALIADQLLFAIYISGPEDGWLRPWFGTLCFIAYGMSAVFASSAALLMIWRRKQVARWYVCLAAQFVGLATFFVGFSMSPSTLTVVVADTIIDQYDTWYLWRLDPRLTWLVLVYICTLLSGLAVMRLWRGLDGADRAPWPAVLFLVLFVGYLAGLGKVAGYWPSSWLFGAFFMARHATYLFYFLEPRDGKFTRSAWFACYLATVALCVLTTAHQVMTGSFATPRVALMAPFALIGFHASPWTFTLSLTAFLTRDLLLLVWLNRRFPNKFPDAIGIAVLAAIYLNLPSVFLMLGIGPLLPVIVPLFASSPADFIGPIATIALLLYWILRPKRRAQA